LVVTVVDTDPPEAGFWAPESVKLGETITLDASASTDNLGIRTYEWRIVRKDRTDVLRGMTVNVPMDKPGTYKVTLTVRDAAGNEDSEEVNLYVPPKESGTDAPFGLWAGMVAALAAAVLLGYLYARRRYGDEE
ncbi:MAG: PKD domain-containing protein, partial [Thermoplasmata archaeon]|nr:PKD domain-containing protein [Thermoplasmata archaeon]NIS10647.1 PKD domain-containing protein [Thermoplasmata archaeon]NIS18606.1 PKD domain-containing protein [Thermoplasmata archaeon]NIT75597.1 PKD domain-containing protein [Thermoplasmata archaeon]NIU47759.1 PKD domain-containing protein [Thermoplasmata archaeon]